MSDKPQIEREPEEPPPETLSRFQKLARALFAVEKRHVEKHEPKRRGARAAISRD